jgi:maltose alpha-D-glucosyltransferase/alpha-amylase
MDRADPNSLEQRVDAQWWNDPLWYRDAVIYQLHVKAFYDSNGDGIGDFAGLTQKLDYIRDLGANAVWLLPFYPSPMRDDGYDIADYRGIHPEYGDMADFRYFVKEAHRRGIKVITELVINHTSDQHPWFQAARRAPADSSKRAFYVWSESDQKWADTRIIFTDTESSNWSWDPVANSYYWHRFFTHQPDLNFDNPSVVKAIMRVMRYWLDLGVDGMRLDAIPYLCERDGTNNENLPETHAVLKYMRAELDRRYTNRFFLAEANQWPEDVREYFGDGDECHMAFHFPLMPRIYMSIALEERHPITDIMAQTPEIPASCQWAVFLRNHDELTLEMVTERERDYMYQIYATDKRMRINVGIRRRLAPLMENNGDKLRLVHSLLFSISGSPILYYGDEIGMGDNVYLGDRNGVRTPMQWAPDRNAGFSRADPAKLYLPPIMDAIYGYESVNVEAQIASPSSFLNWMRRMVAVRKAHKAFGRGSLKFFHPANRKILAYVRTYEDEVILCVANLARSSQPVELDLAEYQGRVPVELVDRTPFPPVSVAPYFLTLPGYCFYWFNLAKDVAGPDWHESRALGGERPVLVLPEGWRTLFAAKPDAGSNVRGLLASRVREQLEREVLPGFLNAQRWFAAKGRTPESLKIAGQIDWTAEGSTWFIAVIRLELKDEPPHLYSLPLALAWVDEGYDGTINRANYTLARVRQRAKLGVLLDAAYDNQFCRAFLGAVGRRMEQQLNEHWRLHFWPTQAFAAIDTAALKEVRRPSMEQSNTSVVFDDAVVLKMYRRLQTGINPEIEMGRFLTEASPFANIAPLVGAVDMRSDDGRVIALAALHRFLVNQGSGWTYSVEHLKRFFEMSLTPTPERSQERDGLQAAYLALIAILGKRTGELHTALAAKTGDAAFDPETVAAEDLAAWRDAARSDLDSTLGLLQSRVAALAEADRGLAESVVPLRERLHERIDALAQQPPAPQGEAPFTRTRYHGDYHLGQVLLVSNDFFIIDFEGEPARPLEQRRGKHSPLRDVAGMLTSFDYAAANALRHYGLDRPEDAKRLEPIARDWQHAVSAAFLDSCRAAARECSSYPQHAEGFDRLVELFVLEKTLYEVRYELNNRPDWVGIPLTRLVRMFARS